MKHILDVIYFFTFYIYEYVFKTICSGHRNTTSQDILFIGLNKQIFECKIVNIVLPISFSICFGCSKEPVLKRTVSTVLLSTHKICFS